jgi:hypothetical protein
MAMPQGSPMSNGSTRLGIALILFTSGAWLLGLCIGVPDHLTDPTWPPHARFHTFQALLWLVALNATIAALALGPARRGERWALVLLAVLFICGQGSYFVAYVLVPGGAPPEPFADVGSAISATLYAVGLILLASRVSSTVS